MNQKHFCLKLTHYGASVTKVEFRCTGEMCEIIVDVVIWFEIFQVHITGCAVAPALC